MGSRGKTASAEKPTDLELALKAATRASEIREEKDAAILDTLARCHYELGQLDEAIKVQQKAVDLDSNMQEIAEALKRYQDERLRLIPTDSHARKELGKRTSNREVRL